MADHELSLIELVASNATLESALIPAPISIALLAQVAIVASKEDFPLDKVESFKYIDKSKPSFRAALTQVVHWGRDAFLKAEENMRTITSISVRIPETVKSVVKLLTQGDPEDIEDFVPELLQKIKKAASDCEKLATEVESKFELEVQLIHELVQLFTYLRGQEEIQLSEYKGHQVDVTDKLKVLQLDDTECAFGSTRVEVVDECLRQAEYNYKLLEKYTMLDIQSLNSTKIREVLLEGTKVVVS